MIFSLEAHSVLGNDIIYDVIYDMGFLSCNRFWGLYSEKLPYVLSENKSRATDKRSTSSLFKQNEMS